MLSAATDEEQIQEETQITVSLFLLISCYLHRRLTSHSHFLSLIEITFNMDDTHLCFVLVVNIKLELIYFN